MIRSRGHCNTMGTASTMACVAEALGHDACPATRALPAADSRLLGAGPRRRRPVVEMVARGPAPERGPHPRRASQRDRRARRDRRLDQRRRAPARDRRPRSGVDLDARRLRPRGARRAAAGRPPARGPAPDGGLPPRRRPAAPCCARSRDLLDADALTVTGRAAGRRTSPTPPDRDDDGHPPALDAPLRRAAGIAVLRGNLAPDGAVIKPAAATPALLRAPRPRRRLRQHRGLARPHRRSRPRHRRGQRAGAARLRARGATRACPRSANMPLPQKLLRQGRARHGADLRRPDERHRVRHRRAARRPRVRGRRAARPGPRPATSIELDVAGPAPAPRRRPPPSWPAASPRRAAAPAAPQRGWEQLYVDHVLQADQRRRPRLPPRAPRLGRRQGVALSTELTTEPCAPS